MSTSLLQLFRQRDDAVDEMSPEELEPMFSERIEKWTEELRAEGEA
jgi:hypothetical protein